MPINQSLENQFVDQQKKQLELEIQNETLDREINELLSYAGVNENQITAFLAQPTHFNEKNWQTLLEEKKKLDTKLSRELDNLVSPSKRKKSREGLRISPHWLPVR